MYDFLIFEWYDDLRKLILWEIYDVFIFCILIDFVNLENEINWNIENENIVGFL